MKKTIVMILKVVLFPLIYCYRVIQDAPIICCDNELTGYRDCRFFMEKEDACKAVSGSTRNSDCHVGFVTRQHASA